ncbi:MAG: beta-lactamase family protein [Treponema sp.]|jgi:CubicO group peptidase (beta-lactamase class C family)|nr:beta-lactamase family protein [Treponema sp.]
MSNFNDISALLEAFCQKGPPGCGCALAKDGKILYECYHGLANVEDRVPMTEDTVFRLFSMTKLIVCSAALIQFERGRFLLNEPLYEYFPEYRSHRLVKIQPNGGIVFEEAKNPMLIKHAFSMAVGLPHFFEQSPSAAAMKEARGKLEPGKFTLRQEIAAMAEVPIAFEPGTHFLYGYGHDLVAGLVELTSGKSIGAFLKDEIFDPLEMNSTGYRFRGNLKERMSPVYQRNKDGSLGRNPANFDADYQGEAVYEGGGTGLFSTVRDYLSFTQMLANGGEHKGRRIIGRKTIDLMRRNQLNEVQLRDFANSYNAGYGYGLGVRTMMDPAAGNSNSSIGEFGWTGAAGTWTSIDPSEGFSAVYMHQTMPNMEEYHHLRFRAAVYGSLR